MLTAFTTVSTYTLITSIATVPVVSYKLFAAARRIPLLSRRHSPSFPAFSVVLDPDPRNYLSYGLGAGKQFFIFSI